MARVKKRRAACSLCKFPMWRTAGRSESSQTRRRGGLKPGRSAQQSGGAHARKQNRTSRHPATMAQPKQSHAAQDLEKKRKKIALGLTIRRIRRRRDGDRVDTRRERHGSRRPRGGRITPPIPNTRRRRRLLPYHRHDFRRAYRFQLGRKASGGMSDRARRRRQSCGTGSGGGKAASRCRGRWARRILPRGERGRRERLLPRQVGGLALQRQQRFLGLRRRPSRSKKPEGLRLEVLNRCFAVAPP